MAASSAVILVLLIAATSALVCDVHDFNARDDNATINTAAIQAAIDACSSAGGTVVFKRQDTGVFVSGSLFLKVIASQSDVPAARLSNCSQVMTQLSIWTRGIAYVTLPS
jgi:hypothetical protein